MRIKVKKIRLDRGHDFMWAKKQRDGIYPKIEITANLCVTYKGRVIYLIATSEPNYRGGLYCQIVEFEHPDDDYGGLKIRDIIKVNWKKGEV